MDVNTLASERSQLIGKRSGCSKALRKAGFILRTKIYAVSADHFAHMGRVFSATNADLRRSDRADGKYSEAAPANGESGISLLVLFY